MHAMEIDNEYVAFGSIENKEGNPKSDNLPFYLLVPVELIERLHSEEEEIDAQYSSVPEEFYSIYKLAKQSAINHLHEEIDEGYWLNLDISFTARNALEKEGISKSERDKHGEAGGDVWSLLNVIQAAFIIGGLGGVPESLRKVITNAASQNQAARARAKRKVHIDATKATRRKAIREAFKGRELVATSKIVEAHRQEICQIAGVDANQRGYSTRQLQREIGAILKERRKN
jgi:hypothetical protein